MNVDQKQTELIRFALARYLEQVDPREAAYRDLARQHCLLPILPDWSGFVGLREDGALFWVSDDNGLVSSDTNAHALHLAKIRGAELFPELAFLAPTVTLDWVICWSCDGAGKVMIDGRAVDDVRCMCGGTGRLPPDLAKCLRAVSSSTG